jgi:pyruvate/2-oxoglutarate dehydrogenase complex dihydrolipoamide acyltransferase (E2) component
MPKTSTNRISGIQPVDLAYAVGRLIAAGKTTAAEVARLAAERAKRIKAIEMELTALKGGGLPTAAPEAARPVAAKAKKAAPKPTAAKKRPAPEAPKVITRKDGRKFTTTPKVVAARKVQGQYLGYLRQVPEKEKARFKALAREKGVPVAVAALKLRLGKGGTRAAPAKQAKPVAAPKPSAAAKPVAKPKKKALPASYYRCAHPGCTKNWFVRGRPYCGEHAKLHGKGKAKK